jgi:sulfur-oxidizing protein SoxY
VKIWQGDEALLAMEGSIAISEDPNIRFTFAPNGKEPFRVEVSDTKDRVFKGAWPFQASEM